jgi:hypothetical protein
MSVHTDALYSREQPHGKKEKLTTVTNAKHRYLGSLNLVDFSRKYLEHSRFASTLSLPYIKNTSPTDVEVLGALQI